MPGKSALVSHHAGDLDTIYRQARADGVSFGTALDDPAPSWQWEPLDAVATEAFRNHEWPLWQPYNGFGSPLLATLDSSVFSPTKLLLYLGVTDNRTWVFVAHLIIAGTFSYAVGAAWGWHPLSCATTALAFVLSSYFTSLRHYPEAVSASLLPIGIWSAQRVAARKPGSVPTLGTLLGTLVLSGHPEASLAMIGAIGLYGLTEAYSSHNWLALRSRNPRAAAEFGLSAFMGILTSAIVLFPLFEVLFGTVSHVRARPTNEVFDIRFFTSLITFFGSIILPKTESTVWLGQSFWHAAYGGPLTIILLVFFPKLNIVKYFSFISLLFVIILINLLTPPHGLLTSYIYFLSYYSIGIGVLFVSLFSGLLLNYLLFQDCIFIAQTKNIFIIFIIITTLLIAIIPLGTVDFGNGPAINLRDHDLLAWSTLPFIAAAIMTITKTDGSARQLALTVVTVLSVVWLVIWNISRHPAVNDIDRVKQPNYLAQSFPEYSIGRITGLDYTTLQGNSASNWKLHDLKLSGAFHTCRFLEFAALASDPVRRDPCNALSDEINVTLTGASSRGLHLAGVSTILYPPARTTAFPSPPVEASLTYADPYVASATLNRTLPRAYLVRRARSCERPVHDALDAIFSQEFDPFTEVFLEPGIPPGNRDLAPDVDHDWRTACPVTQLEPDGSTIAAVHPTDYRHTSVTFDLDVDSPAWLVLLDRNAPGWTATKDGVPTTISTANALFRAVRVEPTSRRVEFRYWPSGFTTGLTITLTTMAGAALALIAALYRAVRSGSREDVVAVTAGLVLTMAQAGTILGFAPR